VTAKAAAGAPMSVFERYLTVWVFLCIVAGIALGQLAPGVFQAIGRMEVAQVNLPVGLLIWVMIIPMLVKVDFGALHEVKQHVRGIGVTLFVNWLVKPFSMAFWLAVRAPPVRADAAGRPARQLHRRPHPAGRGAVHGDGVRVEPADQRRPAVHAVAGGAERHIMVFAFAPLVGLLLGISAITVPWDTLLTSVVLYIVIPVILAQLWRKACWPGAGGLRCRDGEDRPVVHLGAAGHAGAAVRLPGRGHPQAAAGHRAAGGAHPDPGVLQLGAGLLAQPRWARSTAWPARRR
jgi:ACR3 family arsenite transporter